MCVSLINHPSAISNQDFVEIAFSNLQRAGSVCEARQQDMVICSPLGVVPKKNGRLHLILDLR